ncbi:MAG: hypothetical protein JO270_03125, partial [Acidobacteriaceae bacterium]|nr:hypothetical protein [Acidobacteriaceae bacterium]
AQAIGRRKVAENAALSRYIESLFESVDFREIVGSPKIFIRPVETDEELIEELHRKTFKEIPFPGTTTDIQTYLRWHKDPKMIGHHGEGDYGQGVCEGFGVTLRLENPHGEPALDELYGFFLGTRLWEVMAEKFGLDITKTYKDFGIQKYLDGYEISPHPDIRRKALTFMININPADQSEHIPYHTHYLRFKPERANIGEFWSNNPDVERCWVPWDWCVTKKMQTRNNSLVIFAPGNDTLHAVKARYNHLPTQRTQLYGNLWYNEHRPHRERTWREFDNLVEAVQ